ncbi:uncharacterized protein [Acropora muricata]|uniref:uncharacterized protein n=1 Tax=Acropora muricata TaxID=159855 RepID=UPI0034E57640
MTMKPAHSVMHAKAHKWSCQVLWGGRWQEGSACTTGEEVEQINAHMSRCGNTSKYMLPEGRDELITEHALAWNQRKICAMVTNLAKRFKQASAMCASSKDNCVAILQQYNLQLKDVNVLLWKEEIIPHAKDEELVSSSRLGTCTSGIDKLKQQMEMISFSIARRTQVINKETDTSKQRTRLRKKNTQERSQLKSIIVSYNALVQSNGGAPLTMDSLLAGEPPPPDFGQSDAIPVRVKSKIVDTFQIHDRWTEEVALLKTEMSNLLRFYTDQRIPKRISLTWNMKLIERKQSTSEVLITNNEEGGKVEQTVFKYSCSESRPDLLQGKAALLKKGLVFCRDQVKKATSSFQKIIRGDNSNITDPPTYAGDDETDHSDDDNVDESKESSSSESISDANVPMRAFNHYNTTWIWEFPYNISQSTFQGRNGSNACSIIALLIAQGIHKVKCELYPSPMLPSVWVTLVCGCIKVGNALYDRSRGSLPKDIFLPQKQPW